MALDAISQISTQVAFYAEILVDYPSEIDDFFVSQHIRLFPHRDPSFRQDFERRGATNAVDVRQADFDAFISW
jgi:hypothetical protein